MKHITLFVLTLLLGVTVQAQSLLNSIPDNPTLVLKVKGEKLWTILDESVYKSSDLYAMSPINMNKSVASYRLNVMKFLMAHNLSFDNYGLNKKSDSYFSLYVSDQGVKQLVSIPVKDYDKTQLLLDFIAQEHIDNVVETKSKNSILVQSNYWNFGAVLKKDVLYLFEISGIQTESNTVEAFVEDDMAVNNTKSTWEIRDSIRKVKEQAYLKDYILYLSKFNNKQSFLVNNKVKSNSITNDNSLLACYYNFSLTDYSEAFPPMYKSMLNQFTLLENNYAVVGLDFNEGEVNFDYSWFGNKEQLDYSKKLLSTKPSSIFYNYVNENNILAQYSYALNYPVIKEYLRENFIPIFDSLPMINQFGIKESFDVLDIIIDDEKIFNIIKGDLFLAIEGLKDYSYQEYEYTYDDEGNSIEQLVDKNIKIPVVKLMLGINDKQEFQKLIRLAGVYSKIEAVEDCYKITLPEKDFENYELFYKLEDNVFIISNDLKSIQYKNTEVKSSFESTTELKVYIDRLIKEIKTNYPFNKTEKDILGILESTFNTIQTKKVSFSDNSTSSGVSINLKNTELNSLVQIFNLIEGVIKSKKN